MSGTLLHRVKHALGIRSDAEIAREVLSEPKVREARRLVRRVDTILAELEVVEQLPPQYGRRAGDRVGQ